MLTRLKYSKAYKLYQMHQFIEIFILIFSFILLYILLHKHVAQINILEKFTAKERSMVGILKKYFNLKNPPSQTVSQKTTNPMTLC